MSAGEPQLLRMLEVGCGPTRRRIATLRAPGRTPGKPGLIWLTGLKSDMESTKAEALAAWAAQRGIGMTRFDYSGHGRSDGKFEDAVISDWTEEALAVFENVAEGPVILVGSSTGGHVALVMLKQLLAGQFPGIERVAGLVLIAPAWDLSEALMWEAFPDEARHDILTKGFWVRPSAYDPAGYVITRRFIEDGRKALIGNVPFNPGRPVSIIQGLLDTDVPPAHTRRLMELLDGPWATLTEVPDGGHRLSRPEDLETLYGLLDAQIAGFESAARQS